ncbi:hypothetical protein PPTG_20709 [Phytophthora nicotianae INRA-310]|uniref:Uncharacterized protein n=1 Tax=Phytophthora nicotianae (strain INRA-310) TaxID=761204 RepID=W2RF07_PHYN3|nr:hypothetical protein PPTG_20709 [Phytophthora nicotianae INRA-310]ETN23801.1 hypothetical protein PPTG_20709 [Phytophthora nicotianae INRA-310]
MHIKEISQCTSIYTTVQLVMFDSLSAVLAASDDATANPSQLTDNHASHST